MTERGILPGATFTGGRLGRVDSNARDTVNSMVGPNPQFPSGLGRSAFPSQNITHVSKANTPQGYTYLASGVSLPYVPADTPGFVNTEPPHSSRIKVLDIYDLAALNEILASDNQIYTTSHQTKSASVSLMAGLLAAARSSTSGSAGSAKRSQSSLMPNCRDYLTSWKCVGVSATGTPYASEQQRLYARSEFRTHVGGAGGVTFVYRGTWPTLGYWYESTSRPLVPALCIDDDAERATVPEDSKLMYPYQGALLSFVGRICRVYDCPNFVPKNKDSGHAGKVDGCLIYNLRGSNGYTTKKVEIDDAKTTFVPVFEPYAALRQVYAVDTNSLTYRDPHTGSVCPAVIISCGDLFSILPGGPSLSMDGGVDALVKSSYDAEVVRVNSARKFEVMVDLDCPRVKV